MPGYSLKPRHKENALGNRVQGSLGPARRKPVACVEAAPALPPPRLTMTMPLDFSADMFNSTVAKAVPAAAASPEAASVTPAVAPVASAPAASAEPKRQPLGATQGAGGGKVKEATSMARKRFAPLGNRPAPNYLKHTRSTNSLSGRAHGAAAPGDRPPALSGAASAAERSAKTLSG